MARSPFIFPFVFFSAALHLAVAGCSSPAGGPTASSADPSAAPPSADRSARPPVESQKPDQAGEASATPPSGKTAAPPPRPVLRDAEYLPRWTLTPGKQLYFEIENEFRDDYHLMLKVATEIHDRRTVVQTISPPNADFAPLPGQERFVPVVWECSRYEVREKTTGKEELTFDSLRHLYPPMPLRGLGSIAGSHVTFAVDPAGDDVRVRKVQPGKIEGGSAGPQLSGTIQHCALSDVNVANLLDDLWRLYLPDGPVGIGDDWTARRTEGVEKLGQIAIDYTFKLTDVRRDEDRQIATIDISGDIELHDASDGGNGKPGNPAGRTRPVKENQKFKIDRSLCEGNIEFDLTGGELVQLVLRREVDLGAQVDSPNLPTIAIRKNSSHVLRVRTGQSPPPQPVIVGVRQPPKEPAEPPRSDRPRQNPRAGRPLRRGPATQSAHRPTATTLPAEAAARAAAARARRANDRSSGLGAGATPATRPAVRRGLRQPTTTQPAAPNQATSTPATQPPAQGSGG